MEWQHEIREIKTLRENPDNPRSLSKKQGEELKKSLCKFGQCEPIVIQPDGTIIGGHQRFKILKKMGEKHIDVYCPETPLSESEVKELTIRLNKNQGDWDFDTLATVTALLRRGRKTILTPPKKSLEMKCQDCGSTEGYTCRDGEHRCWFYANEECMEKDSEITKEMARKARRHKF